MERAWKIGLLTGLICSPLLVSGQSAKPPVTVAMTTDRSTYRIGEDIKLNLKFENKGKAPAILWMSCGHDSPELHFWVLGNSRKRTLKWPHLCDNVSGARNDDFAKIGPGESLKVLASLPAASLRRRSGTYELEGNFSTSVENGGASGLLSVAAGQAGSLGAGQVRTLNKRTVASNRVRIRVRVHAKARRRSAHRKRSHSH